MPVEFKYPWVGVAIPAALIIYLQSSTTYLWMQDKHEVLSDRIFLIFQFANMMLWISYCLAIVTPPGSPAPDYQLPQREFGKHQTMWRKFCIKCNKYKPERTHHCRKCDKCVLKMDHHCPWTNNCIGFKNFPHFIKFLVWIEVTLLIGWIYYAKKLYGIFEMRSLPSYLISTSDVTVSIINTLMVSFIFLTISILFIRCLSSAASNQTMIEEWECDRIQDNFFTEKLWIKVRHNYSKIYPDERFPDLKSWKVNYRILKQNTQIPLNFTYEDLVFPYDLGSAYLNLVDSIGPLYTWILPWGGPNGDGINFIKDALKEDQIKLPFPIDGSNFDDPKSTFFGIDDDNELVTSNDWANYLGETLNDFGVDLETETYDDSKNK